jgi:hypothetical protein
MKQLFLVLLYLLFPLLFVPIIGRMNFEKAVFKVNKDFGTGNMTITNIPSGTALSIFSNLVVALDGKIMVTIILSTQTG